MRSLSYDIKMLEKNFYVIQTIQINIWLVLTKYFILFLEP